MGRRDVRSVHRGQIVRADIGLAEPTLFVVVSNNARNGKLPTVLAARPTTTADPRIRSIVGLDGAFTGAVVCDDIIDLHRDDEVLVTVGGLASEEMARVDDGLRAALPL